MSRNHRMIAPSGFKPLPWLRNPHLQTLWPHFARAYWQVAVRRERLELPDGDFLDLHWNQVGDGPIVVILHGLGGSIESHYAKGMLHALQQRGWRGVLMHFRGASGEPNRLVRSYHGGETGDLASVIDTLRRRYPDTPLAAIGYSLGGNVLLKWLGEQGRNAPLVAAAAVSVPFDLSAATQRLNQGLSRLYQWRILSCLKKALESKARHTSMPVDMTRLNGITTFRQLDELVTAPLHGFASADDYYTRSSARGYLRGITTPTLITHALDDPFVPSRTIPEPGELSSATTLELSSHGGHVGFLSGAGGRPRYWLEQRLPVFLAPCFATCVPSMTDSNAA